MDATVREFRIFREGDQVFLQFADAEAKVAIKLAWARPLSARGGEIAVIGPDKQEVLFIKGLDALDAASRTVAEEELARRYVFPRIKRVLSATASFGVRYWHVETDLGERRFALKNAAKNAVWLSEDHLILTDTIGCRYEVTAFSALDERSRAAIDAVI